MLFKFGKKDEKKQRTVAKFGKDLDFTSTEAYNLLRTNIIFSISEKGNGGKVIGTTSANPADGKSYTSINLGYALAKDGAKVLVIDADMRKPSIEKTLDIPNKFGLSNILIGQEGEGIQKSVLHENMDIMTSGTIPPNPSELIGAPKMAELLQKEKETYDYILIDLPPVNVVTDSLTLAKKLDGYILVVRHNVTKKREMLEAIKKLKYVEAKILGVVYNGYSHSHRSGSYYKKGYYKSYHYYSSDNKDDKTEK